MHPLRTRAPPCARPLTGPHFGFPSLATADKGATPNWNRNARRYCQRREYRRRLKDRAGGVPYGACPAPIQSWRRARRDARRDARVSRWVHGMHLGATAGPKPNGRRVRLRHRGRAFFGGFLCTSKESHPGCGAEHPAITRREAARALISPSTKHSEQLLPLTQHYNESKTELRTSDQQPYGLSLTSLS